MVAADGHSVWLRDAWRVAWDEQGKCWKLSGLMVDITERVQMEKAIKYSLRKLEEDTREITLLGEMGDLLQTSRDVEEAYAISAQSARKLFPAQAGALYVISASRNLLEAVAVWGESPQGSDERVFAPDDCWALRRGQVHLVLNPSAGLVCKHVRANGPATLPYLCVPMMAQSEALGVLHLQCCQPGLEPGERNHIAESKQRLAEAVADSIALALANLKLRETLRNQSIRDPLTGLFNRRYMEETLERETRRAKRSGASLGIIMADIDHFKRFNDAYGHEAGDAVLRALGKLLQTRVRGEDIACRYGGEEFTFVLPSASLHATQQRAEELREQAQYLRVEQGSQSLGSLTLSLGVAVYPQHAETWEAVLQAADAALYRAKESGRNRVMVSGNV
jgi:diguanylate cyclase (GGDEF)-like protein